LRFQFLLTTLMIFYILLKELKLDILRKKLSEILNHESSLYIPLNHESSLYIPLNHIQTKSLRK